MKKSSYAATHSGECQLCGHTQKLPGGGRLSLHGYTTRWGFFSGVCSGARGWPYETHTDLIEGEIVRQRAEIARLKAFAAEVASPSFPDVFVAEHVPMNVRGTGPSTIERRLTKDEVRFVNGALVWTVSERNQRKGNTEQKIEGYGKTLKAIIAEQNARKVSYLEHRVTEREGYVEWLTERKAKWVKRELTALAPEEIGTKATIVHGFGAYWSKREGRDIAACVSSIRSAGYKLVNKDWAKVTCKACLKVRAAQQADEVLSAAANAVIAEMVTKYGEQVRVQFSSAADAAVKEVRYQRKDLDKEIRSLVCARIERGIK